MYGMTTAKRNILITGAGSGLGRGLSICLAQRGHEILATDLHLGLAQETIAQVARAGGAGKAYALDVSSEAQVRQVLSDIGECKIDALINNAGLQRVAKVEEFTVADWDLITNVILKGAFLMTRAVLPSMRKQGFGRIIQIGSIHSLIASRYKSAYVAAKHGLIGFSKVIALETGDVDITVNTICPSYIRTPLVDAQITEQARISQIAETEVIDRIMMAPMPKKAFISFEEVTSAVDYLISSSARNITGQTITLDGGWTAQ